MKPTALRLSAGGLLAGLLLLILGGCGREPATPASGSDPAARPIVIGVSLLNLSSEFIGMIERALQNKARAAGVKLLVSDAQRSAERQIQQVENFIAQRVDAIILNPCEVEASSPAVDKARAAGIPIVNVNSETRSMPDAFIGSRDEESAELAVEFLAGRLNGRGGLVMMQGFLGQAAQLKRDAGARAVLSRHPGLRLLAQQTAEWDRAKAVTLMENWIQAHGTNLQAVFAQNDEMGMGAVLALEQAGLKDRVLVASVDAIADAMQAVQAGRLDATVFQDARGQAEGALDVALKLARKEPPGATHVLIPFRLVTRENVAELLR